MECHPGYYKRHVMLMLFLFPNLESLHLNIHYYDLLSRRRQHSYLPINPDMEDKSGRQLCLGDIDLQVKATCPSNARFLERMLHKDFPELRRKSLTLSYFRRGHPLSSGCSCIKKSLHENPKQQIPCSDVSGSLVLLEGFR